MTDCYLESRETDAWSAVGRDLLVSELGRRRSAVTEAFHVSEDALRNGEELTAHQIRDMRRALNMARLAVETHAARVADGVDSWDDDDVPEMPYGVYRHVLES